MKSLVLESIGIVKILRTISAKFNFRPARRSINLVAE